MRVYFTTVLGLYILISAGFYIMLNAYDLQYAKTIVGFSLLGALIYHLIMESIIGIDDYDEKSTFKECLSDFPYCFAVGMVAFSAIALGLVGFSFIKDGRPVVGGVCIVSAILFVSITHLRKRA